jgi:uncharacterized membrane protein YfcA
MLACLMDLNPLQWATGALGAILVGISKTGLAGLSALSVAVFAQVFPSKQATGLVLPLLILGDFLAVLIYRQHAQWRHLRKLFPWTAAGVVLGYFTLAHVSDRGARYLIGAIIICLAGLSYWWRSQSTRAEQRALSVHWSVGASIGIAAGFITLIANAAGPLMAMYFVAMRLPKLEYVGTAAVFFMLLNLFKVPFMVDLGLINFASIKFNLMLAPGVLLGVAAGRWLLARINQNAFEQTVLILSATAGILLIL